MSQNLPALQQKAQSISEYLNRDYIKRQLEMALPKHLTAERLLRVAMTTIRHNRKLLECSLESLLASVMGCAQLGLEPEPALGQAYLVPYWNEKKHCLEAQLIPGYRGYITLARRSGEVQTVSAQVVYSNDCFKIKYGLDEVLDHVPADGDRGEAKGAYVVFKYKDGSHSFDYMTIADIDKIKERSKSRNKKGELVGPWITDEDEMRKKTVIRRHIKLVPLSVEMATAAAAEEKAFAGESQAGLFLDTQDADFTEVGEEDQEEAIAKFDTLFTAKNPTEAQKDLLEKHLALYPNETPNQVKARAAENFEGTLNSFWEFFTAWCAKQAKPSEQPKRGRPKQTPVPEPEDAATGTTSGSVPGITAEQLEYLQKVPVDILMQAWVDAGVPADLPLEELDMTTAEKMVKFCQEK